MYFLLTTEYKKEWVYETCQRMRYQKTVKVNLQTIWERTNRKELIEMVVVKIDQAVGRNENNF